MAGALLVWGQREQAGIAPLATVSPSITPKPTPKTCYDDVILPATLTDLMNSERTKRGLKALVYDERLATAARSKAADMLARGYWAHNAPDGTEPWLWFTKAGYKYTYAGENLAKDFTDNEEAVRGWMASPLHRDNILGTQYEDVGIAVACGTLAGQPATLIVAMYGR